MCNELSSSFKELAGMLREKGFTTVVTDINVRDVNESSEMLNLYAKGPSRAFHL